jgi:membrane protein implicated in regulation of membrane protease activity
MVNANIGNADRIARIILGAVLIALAFVGPKTAWGWIGLVPLLTGLVRWCPAYRLIGVNTCRKA